jgi:hypothetical protein
MNLPRGARRPLKPRGLGPIIQPGGDVTLKNSCRLMNKTGRIASPLYVAGTAEAAFVILVGGKLGGVRRPERGDVLTPGAIAVASAR